MFVRNLALVAALAACVVPVKAAFEITITNEAVQQINDFETIFKGFLTDQECYVLDFNVEISMDHTFVGDLGFWVESDQGFNPIGLVYRPGTTAVSGSPFGNSLDLVGSLPVTYDDASSLDPETQFGLYPDLTTTFMSNPTSFSNLPAGFLQSGFGGQLNGPFQSLTGLNDVTVPAGSIWKIGVTDQAGIDVGDLNSATIHLKCADCEIQPGGCGDPHYTTFGATNHFDFQGACDLAMVENPGYKNGKGLYVHTRTELFGSWSAIVGAAVRIGDDILEVHGEDMALINGIEYPVPVDRYGTEFNYPMTIGGYSLTVQLFGPHSRRHIIHMGDGEKIILTSFKQFVDVAFVGEKAEDFDGAVGLLGAYSQGGAMLARDGKTVIEDGDAMGYEWQVRPTDPQLFSIIDGPQYPTRCQMPEKSTAEKRHLRAMAKKVSEDDAKKACANASRKENCIADVFGSDNLEMANIYTMGNL
jgi:hypothetical protein